MKTERFDKKLFKQEVLNNLKTQFRVALDNASQQQIYQAVAYALKEWIIEDWMDTQKTYEEKDPKILYYMSMEFLMGRALGNNLINMSMYGEVKEALEELGVDLNMVEDQEPDPALGNGGLGRLAACFLDSLATLGYAAYGCGIRYQYGMFKQKIKDGYQIEVPDEWLKNGNPFELKRPEYAKEVRFGGNIRTEYDEAAGRINFIQENYQSVMAVPYDYPVVGYGNHIVNTLRIWDAEPITDFQLDSFDKGEYDKAVEQKNLAKNIVEVLYPNDNHYEGKELRLKQQYFFVSASLQAAVAKYKKNHDDITKLYEKMTIQMNDTHPTVSVAELMRILMDEEGLGWDEAWEVTTKTCAYTNHTIMTEAMECWDENMFRFLLPRIYQIVCAFNEKYCNKIRAYYSHDEEKVRSMAIIGNNEIRMANLCVALCRRINGVSNLHADILKTRIFKGSYQIFPQKYLAITNGITHRRWFGLANQGLYHLAKEYIKGDILKDYHLFEQFLLYKEDEEFLKKYSEVKENNKIRFAKYIKEKQGIEINPDSIFDVHCKRLHEYKRQLMKCLHIIYVYQRIKKDPECITTLITFIFAAKAAPGYTKAKEIIRLIHSVAEMVNKDPDMKGKIQLVFVEDYCVSVAEMLIPAADISEQISTAGMEASGTGNMKFMMNGALTIGTMDGANIEIAERVGRENIFIFGDSAEGNYNKKTYHTYNPGIIFENNPWIRDVCNCLIEGNLLYYGKKYSEIYQSLLFGEYGEADPYYVLADFPSYIETYETMYRLYVDQKEEWIKKTVINTAKSGYFSSDRTIEQYNEKIWNLKPVK